LEKHDLHEEENRPASNTITGLGSAVKVLLNDDRVKELKAKSLEREFVDKEVLNMKDSKETAHRSSSTHVRVPKANISSSDDNSGDNGTSNSNISTNEAGQDMKRRLEEFRQRKKEKGGITNVAPRAGVNTATVTEKTLSPASTLSTLTAHTSSSAAAVRSSNRSVVATAAVKPNANTNKGMGSRKDEKGNEKEKEKEKPPRVNTKVNSKPLSAKGATITRSSASTKPAKASTMKKAPSSLDDAAAMAALLKKHNAQFQMPSVYEPPRHSVRDLRRWEKQNGRMWATMNPTEREQANREIEDMKRLERLKNDR
jgi:hypothetical protein